MTAVPAGRGDSLQRVIDALARGGHRLKHSGNHVQASCPLHTDTNPSLSIDHRDDRVEMYCHSNECDPRDIAEALGIRFDELWDEPLQDCPVCGKPSMPATSGEYIHPYCAAKRDGKSAPKRIPQSRPKPDKKRADRTALPARVTGLDDRQVEVVGSDEIGRWEHVDPYTGEVVAESVKLIEHLRYDTGETEDQKTYYQRYGTPAGWRKRKPADLQIPLWRSSEVAVAIAAGLTIWLAEGHKDAQALLDHGADEATTNISGASTFSEADARQLDGADVIICCDRDLAGFRRGVKINKMLNARSVRIVLPLLETKHADAHDHLTAGYTLEEFADVTVDELQALVILEEAAEKAGLYGYVLDEIRAHVDLAQKAAGNAVDDHHQKAVRWAAQAGKVLTQLGELRDQLGRIAARSDDQLGVLDEHLDSATEVTREAHALAGEDPEDVVAALLGSPEELPDNVVKFPTQPGRPAHSIPMSTTMPWAYSLGNDDFDRGVYLQSRGARGRPGPWEKVADLPYAHKRVIRRDGHGKRSGLHYLLSITPDEKPLKFDLLALRDGSWANQLGAELSQDQKVIAAVATAIIFDARDAPEQEATPDIDQATGKIIVPASIDQYFERAPVERAEALAALREVVTELALAPKMAMVFGASAIAPFTHEVGMSHTVSMTGAPRQGKSIALRMAAGVWGDSVHGNGSLYASWNATGQGLQRLLGSLRVLPVFRDETGLAGQPPDYWARLAYQISEGIDRLRYDRVADATMDKPWWGILFSTGNEQFADGCSSGAFQGVPRRIVALSCPFTTDRDHGDRLFCKDAPRGHKGLLERCYGWLGTMIAEQVTVDHVIEVLGRAEQMLTCPTEAESVERLIYMHVAGAMIIDEILDTGTILTEAAVMAAQEYLDSWLPPAREADRVMEAVLDSIAREPSAWPLTAEYAEHLLPFALEDGNDMRHIKLPQAGVSREMLGVRADDGSWVAVFSTAFTDLIPDGINKNLACSQLAEDGILHVQPSRRRRKEFTSWVQLSSDRKRVGSNGASMYKLYLPDHDLEPTIGMDSEPDAVPNDVPADEAPAAEQSTLDPLIETHPTDTAEPGSPDGQSDAVGGIGASGGGAVGGNVGGVDMAVARGVGGVGGIEPADSRSMRANPADSDFVSGDGAVEVDLERGSGTWIDANGTPRKRDWARVSAACEVCGRPCIIVIEGHRIHLPCWDRTHNESPVEPAATEVETPADAQVTSNRQVSNTGSAEAIHPRGWVAPAAVLTAQTGHLPGEKTVDWSAEHLGQVAMLADQWNLGWGGTWRDSRGTVHDPDQMPQKGQIWLTAEALTRLGLPTELKVPQKAMPRHQWQKMKAKQLGQFAQLPAVADALVAGWEMGQSGLTPWTRIWHRELFPAGAMIVFLPWQDVTEISLIDAQPAGPDHGTDEDDAEVDPRAALAEVDPASLADRLAEFARRVGVPYEITPAITGLNLIDYTRPPRRDHLDDLGASRRRVALVKNEDAELPPWFGAYAKDPRWRSLEQDWSWWRPFDQLLESERNARYVVLYDRGRSYLGPWSSIDLGVEGLAHHVGADATWNGKALPGYWLIDKVDWPAWNLPDPLAAAGAAVQGGKVWVTSHTLQQLRMLDLEPVIHESFTWSVTARYLEPASKRLRQALDDQGTDPAVLATIKALYRTAVGKFGEREHLPYSHLWRPDWRHHIIAHSRTAILNQLIKIRDQSGVAPILVDHDAIGFVTDNPDPYAAWPGDPAKLGTGIGAWKPIGIAELGDWGPKHLPEVKPGRRFGYTPAKNDLTLDRLDTENIHSDGDR